VRPGPGSALRLRGGDALMRVMFVAYLTVIAVGLLLMLVVALRHV
jgi:hypothetical protein